MFGHLHWYMWDGAMEETTEMLSMSRPLPSTVIVGVPARKYNKVKKKDCDSLLLARYPPRSTCKLFISPEERYHVCRNNRQMSIETPSADAK